MKVKLPYTISALRLLLFIFVICLALLSYAQSAINENEDIDPHFKKVEIENTTPVQERFIPDSIIKNLQQDDAFWYANREIKKAPAKDEKPAFLPNLVQQQWFRTLLWIIIAGSFAGIIIWYLISLNIQLFRRKSISLQTLQEEKITENIFSINYDSEIDKAVKAGNYRLAVRLLYLQVLKELSEKNIIQYKDDRTNSEYLVQLYNTNYYKDFFRLTRSFEYAWYGQFPVSAPSFRLLQTEFSNFNRRLSY